MSATQVVLAPSHIQTIAHAFDLGAVTVWQQTGKVYRLHAQSGTFALRFYNTGVTRTHIQATQTVRRALAERGLPIAPAIGTATGTTIVEWKGWLGELQPWIVHTNDGGQWAELVTAAAALRHMHNCLATCPVQPDQHDDPWRTPAELAEHLVTHTAVLRQQARQGGAMIDRQLDQAAAILTMLQTSGILDTCPRQLTHGDFQGPNLLFHDHALVGIIDFERLDYRPRFYDLAWPFVFWRWFGTTAGSYTDADWQHARACCDAYAAAAPAMLGDREWMTLPLLMAYIPARGIAVAVNEIDPIAEILAFAKALDFAEWLVQHPAEALARLRT